MARPDPLATLPRRGVLSRYLLDGERILTAVHQHWAKVAEPVASVVAGLVLVLSLDSYLPGGFGRVTNIFWWAWFVLVGRALWKVLEWRHDWFVATDKRLILTYGLITQKVAMMPLAKVTDMSYNRSPMGRLLGYGTFVMESAGQDQALHSVSWVADADRTYRAICAEIFAVDDHGRQPAENEYGHRFRNRPPDGTADPRESVTHSAVAEWEPDSHDVGPYDIDRDPSIREGDTGPISY